MSGGKMYKSFKILPLGTRFQYDERKHGPQERVWVKIYPNLIAEWDASQIATNWTGQQVCSFADNDQTDEEVKVIDDGKATKLLKWLHSNAKIPLTPSRDFYAEDMQQEIKEFLRQCKLL